MPRKFFTDADFQNTSRVTNLPGPQAPGDAANKAYVDSAIEGLAWKDSCRVSAQANVNLASPGATIDGVSMASQDRFLARSQTTQSQNGIYVWNGASSAATRAMDANTFDELEQATVTIEEGTDAGVTFRQTQVNGTIDTSPVVFTNYGTAAPAASESTSGIARIATQADVDGGTDDTRIVTALKLNNWSGRKLKAVANIGDGSATIFNITHGFGTRDVSVAVFPNSGDYDNIEPDIRRPTTSAIQLVFSTAPALNAIRVVVQG